MENAPSSLQEPSPKKLKMYSTTTTDEDIDDATGSTITGEAPKKRRYKRRKVAIFFAYCGVGYQGMQKNPGAKTIEGDLEEALYQAGAVPEEDRGQHKRFDWGRSARTDKGVSALGQVVSGRFYVDPPGFIDRLNSNLSPQIRIFGYKRVTASYSAKKFCDRRRYVYLLPVFALDPSCHRDRESVMASLGSGNELAKCFQCSERGRKVVGIMGKRNFEPKADSSENLLTNGVITGGSESVIESAINGAAEMVTESDDIEADSSKDVMQNEANGAAILSSECEKAIDASSVNSNQVNLGSNTVSGLAREEMVIREQTVVEEEKTEDQLSGNDNGEEKLEQKSEFKYGEVEKERFSRILKHYEGTHNFHNFTTRTKAEDPAAKRYIISFDAKTTLTIDGVDFVKCEVVGQSFMLHQIRKMVGLAVAVMRNIAPEFIFDTAFNRDVHMNVPTAPEVGLYLDECLFTSYNNKWKGTHEELSMKDYADAAEDFKMKYIYPHVASTEIKEGSVALWLHSLNYRNYPDLRGSGASGSPMEKESAETDNNVNHNGGHSGLPVKEKSAETVDNGNGLPAEKKSAEIDDNGDCGGGDSGAPLEKKSAEVNNVELDPC